MCLVLRWDKRTDHKYGFNLLVGSGHMAWWIWAAQQTRCVKSSANLSWTKYASLPEDVGNISWIIRGHLVCLFQPWQLDAPSGHEGPTTISPWFSCTGIPSMMLNLLSNISAGDSAFLSHWPVIVCAYPADRPRPAGIIELLIPGAKLGQLFKSKFDRDVDVVTSGISLIIVSSSTFCSCR